MHPMNKEVNYYPSGIPNSLIDGSAHRVFNTIPLSHYSKTLDTSVGSSIVTSYLTSLDYAAPFPIMLSNNGTGFANKIV